MLVPACKSLQVLNSATARRLHCFIRFVRTKAANEGLVTCFVSWKAGEVNIPALKKSGYTSILYYSGKILDIESDLPLPSDTENEAI